jgi:hypothetical protein
MAQTGQLKGRVSENQLIELLEQVRSHPFLDIQRADILYLADGRSTGTDDDQKVDHCGVWASRTFTLLFTHFSSTIQYQRRRDFDDDDDF